MRGFRDDRQGVATTVGAILIVAIGIVTVVKVRSEYVPIWEGGSEAQHMRLVEGQLAQMKSDLDRAASNRTMLVTPYPITLSQPRTGAFAQADPFDHIEFEPRPDLLNYSSPRILLHSLDGKSLGSLGETWSDMGAGQKVVGIQEIQNFRLRIDNVSKPSSTTPQWIRVSVYDFAGKFAGSFSVDVVDVGGTDYHVVFTVRDAFNDTIYNQPDAIFQGNSISPYWVDLLDPTFPFEPLLQSVPKPFEIRLKQVGLTGDFTLTYATATAGGQNIIVGAGGLDVKNYNRTFSAGSIVYEGRNLHYVDQTFVLEHGAIILDQDDGRVMRMEPVLLASTVPGITSLTLALPMLQGGPSSLVGASLSTLYLRVAGGAQLSATAPGFNLTLPTKYSDVWADYFERKLTDAGLIGTGASPNFSLVPGAESLRVTILGPNADPLSGTHDLQLTILQTHVEVSLG